MTLLPPSLSISTTEQAILDSVDDLHGEMVATLTEWSAQNSGSYNTAGLEVMRETLRSQFSHLPAQVVDVPLTPHDVITARGTTETLHYQPALSVSVRPEAPIQLVLTGHYDTVFPKDSHFQDPVRVDDDTINGPGTADMKGGLLVMFHALHAFERSDQAKNIGYTILMSPDEEIGSHGSAPLLAELGKKSHVGLTYEPALADGSMAGARKGSGIFTLLIRGKAAHAGREHHLGRNAMVAMAQFVTQLDALNGQREGVTINFSKIDGGGATNIVPDLAIGRFNIRLHDDADVKWVRGKLETIIAPIKALDGITAELSGHFHRPPKPMSTANETVFNWVKQAGQVLGQDISWSPSGGVCEGNNLWASGCPNVDTLGVRGGHIHSDKEYVKLSSLVERTRLSTLILMKLASGEFDAIGVKKLAQEST